MRRRRIFPKRALKAVDGATIGPRNGSCGTAMFTRKPVIVEDVTTDPLWADYREFARICGLRACWSTPILSPQGEVLGSFAMYREEKRGPRPEEDRLTKIATHVAGLGLGVSGSRKFYGNAMPVLAWRLSWPNWPSGFCIRKEMPGRVIKDSHLWLRLEPAVNV